MAIRIIPKPHGAASTESASAGAAVAYKPFMTTVDEGNIMPGDDDVPAMVIHPDAKPAALFAVAQSRAALIVDLLAITINDDSEVSTLSEVVRSQVEEVLVLLTEGNARLHAQRREVAHV